MPLPMFTSHEKPSTSETKEIGQNQEQTQATPATDQSQTAGGASGGTKSEVELAAEKLYEERMEEEYAKREGGA